jgi:hypothetical protein
MRGIILSLILFANNCAGCGNVSKNDNNEKKQIKEMKYNEAIDTINRKVVDLTTASDLFNIDEFIGIYENPSLYSEDALRFISDSTIDTQKKQIAVYSMQNLPDSLYINFCSSVADFFIKGIVSKEVLQTAVFNSINERYKVIKNYKDKTVIVFLNAVKSFSNSQELKSRIDSLLSGKTWKNLSDFIENR